MLTKIGSGFTHEDYRITRQSRSDRVFGPYADPRALALRWQNLTSRRIPALLTPLQPVRWYQVVFRSYPCMNFVTKHTLGKDAALVKLVLTTPSPRIYYVDLAG